MKKACLFAGLLFCGFAQLYSQQTVRIVPGNTTVNYLERKPQGKSSAEKKIKVEVEYWGTTPAAPVTVVFEVTNPSSASVIGVTAGTGSVVTPVGGYQIPAADFATEHKTKTFEVYVKLTDVPALVGREFFELQLTGHTGAGDPKHTVIVSDKKIDENPDATKYDESKPYWVETGSNIDLVDGLKLNNVAVGIFFHKVDSRGWKGRNNLSIFAGIYESKNISTESNQYAYDSFVTQKSIVPGTTNLKIYKYWGAPKIITSSRNWSFFCSPQLRITNGHAEDGRFHAFLSLWAELQYQEVTRTTDYSSLLLTDSAIVAMSTLGSYKQIQDTVRKVGVFSHYWGVGMPVSYSDENVKLIFNPVIGLSNQLARDDYFNKIPYPGNPSWCGFYIVQFRLSEKFLGITVTGEIRGLLKKFSPPAYTLALTKKFDLAKLLKYP